MPEQLRPARRTVVVGAGLGVIATAVAACGSSATTSQAGSETSTQAPAPNATSGSSESGALAKVADVPVGSGVIVGDVVVTQPTAGDFKGLSAICTHAGCTVSRITDGKIICPCHNSEFNLDGTVAQGPAKKPLEAKAVSVQGDSIVAG